MVHVVKAKLTDFEGVFILLKELWPQEKFSKKKTKTIYEKLLKNKNSLQLVIKEKEIIAYASISLRDDLQSQGKIAHLSELIVQEAYRGQGYGTLILQKMMQEAKKKKCVEIQFPSTFKRKKAHSFYKKLGFKKTAYFFWKEI